MRLETSISGSRDARHHHRGGEQSCQTEPDFSADGHLTDSFPLCVVETQIQASVPVPSRASYFEMRFFVTTTGGKHPLHLGATSHAASVVRTPSALIARSQGDDVCFGPKADIAPCHPGLRKPLSYAFSGREPVKAKP